MAPGDGGCRTILNSRLVGCSRKRRQRGGEVLKSSYLTRHKRGWEFFKSEVAQRSKNRVVGGVYWKGVPNENWKAQVDYCNNIAVNMIQWKEELSNDTAVG